MYDNFVKLKWNNLYIAYNIISVPRYIHTDDLNPINQIYITYYSYRFIL